MALCTQLPDFKTGSRKLEKYVEQFNLDPESRDDLVDEIIVISKALEDEIPQISDSISLHYGTEIRDANTIIERLKLYLANHDVEYKAAESERNAELKRFWIAFKSWFEDDLPNLNLLKDKYVRWDNWDGGTYYLSMDYDDEFKKYGGISCPDSLKNDAGNFNDIKMFLEIAYKYWISDESKAHYDFTVEVNERFRMFKLPYKMQNGRVLKQGYKTTYGIDKILDYRMFERKIRFSEDMINSDDLMEKKSALDFIIDALQYLISIQGGTREKQYAALALSVYNDSNSKVYAVIKQELNELEPVLKSGSCVQSANMVNS